MLATMRVDTCAEVIKDTHRGCLHWIATEIALGLMLPECVGGLHASEDGNHSSQALPVGMASGTESGRRRINREHAKPCVLFFLALYRHCAPVAGPDVLFQVLTDALVALSAGVNLEFEDDEWCRVLPA